MKRNKLFISLVLIQLFFFNDSFAQVNSKSQLPLNLQNGLVADKTVDDIVSAKVNGVSTLFEDNQPALLPAVSSIPEFRISLYYTEASGFKRLIDGAVALFDNQYTSALDGNDAVDAPNWDENIAITRNGQNLAIESRAQLNENDTLAISMSNMKMMNYELQFQGSNFGGTLLQPLLIDNYLNRLTPLSLTVPTIVPFTVTSDTATSSKNRFKVIFKKSLQVKILKGDTTIFKGATISFYVDSLEVPLSQLQSYTALMTPHWQHSFNTISGKRYKMTISGTWRIGFGPFQYNDYDAAFNISQSSPLPPYSCTSNLLPATGGMWFQNLCGLRPMPDVINDTHVYTYYFVANSNQTSIGFDDMGNYGDINTFFKGELIYTLQEDKRNTISWSTGDTTNSIRVSPTQTTKYYVTVSDGITSCQDSVTVTVKDIFNWTGDAGDDLWNTAGNWSTGTVPLANSDIIINSGSPKLNVDLEVGGSLSISGTGTLTINPGKTLSIDSLGVVDFGGKSVTIKSDVTGTAQIGRIQGTLTGATNITVERYIPATGRRYRMISPSVNTSGSIKANWMEGNMNTSGANVNSLTGFGTQITGPGGNANGFDVTGTNAASLYLTTNGVTPGYTSIANTNGTLNALTGYFLFLRGDRSTNMNLFNTNVPPNPIPLPSSATTLRATGTVVQGTVSSFTNALSATAGGLSMITNPYLAAIDWNAVHAASSNLKNYYYYWDPSLGFRGGFVTVKNNGIISVFSSVSPTIQSGQAFFVSTISNGAPTISIQESHKVGPSGNNVHGIFKANRTVANIASSMVKGVSPFIEKNQTTSQTSASEIPSFSILLYYTESSGYKRLTDGAKAMFDSQYSSALDGDDALDAPNWDENIAITRDSQNLAIESRAQLTENDTLAISMSAMKVMNYELQFQGSNFGSTLLQPMLIDNYLNTITQLSLTQSTTVPFTVTTSPASSSKDRFKVFFRLISQVPPAPTANVTQPTCDESTGTITVSATTEEGMTFSIDGIDYTNASGTFTGVVPGTYNLTVRTSTGFTSDATIVTVNPQPVTPSAPVVNVNHPTCFTATGTITVTSTGILSDTYSIDGINYQSSNIFLGVSAGTYIASVKSAAGCISNAIEVILNQQPVTSAVPIDPYDVLVPLKNYHDTIRVCGDSVELDAGAGFSSYLWSNSAITQKIFVKSSGNYSVSVTNDIGCTVIDTLYVSIINAKILQRDTTILKGASVTLSVDSTVNGGTNSLLPSNLRNGMVAYYPFNGNANDESGNGNNGTITSGSVPFIADRNGKVSSAIQLGGGYIVTTQSVFTFQQNQAFTVSIWFTLETNSSGGRLLSNECPEGNFRIGAGVNGNYAVAYGDYIYDTAPLNTWTHLVYTFDNKSEKVYINGSLKYTNTEEAILLFNHCNALTIGAKAASAFDRWVGKADELIVYNRALSDAEVFQLKNSQSVTWSTGSTNNSITVSPSQTTAYHVTVSDGITSCSDTVNITVQNVFAYDVLPDTINAFKDSVILDAGAGYQAYSWSDGSTSQTIAAKSTGIYKVSVTNASGQMAADQTYVNIIDANIIQNDLTICKSDSVILSLDTTFFVADTTIKSRVDSSNRTEKFSTAFKNTGNFNSPWGSVHHDYMGNIIVSGSYTGAINIDGNITNSYGGTDFFVKKYDSKGNTKWMIDGGSSGSQDFIGIGWSKGIATDKNGNIYFAGRYNQTLTIRGTAGTSFTGTYVPTSNVNHNDGFVVKLDSTGKVIWGVTINGASNDGFDAVTVDPNGNIICLGGLNGCCPSSFVANLNGPVNAVTVQGIGYGTGILVKLSPAGEILWNSRMGNRDVSFGNAVTDADGNIYFTGSQRSWSNGIAGTLVDGSGASSSVLNPGIGLGFLIKLNANGVRQYAIPIGNNGLGEGTSTSVTGIQIKNNRDIYIAGSYAGDLMVFNSTTSSSLSLPASSSYAGFIAKYSKDGVPLTVKQVKKSALGETNLTVIDIDSSFIAVTGYYTGGNAGLNDGAYILYDESLNQLKTKNIGGSLDEYTKGLTISNGQVFVTGNYDASTKFDGETKVGSGSYLWVADTLYSFEQPRYKYKWSTGDTTSSIKVLVDSSRKYFVEVTDGSRLSKDSVSVNIFGQSFNPLKDTLKFRAFSADLDAGAGFAQYKWNTGDTTQKITIRTSGAYKVIVSNGNGCTSSDSSIVSVIDVNIVQKDTTICKGASIQLGIDSTNAITLSDSLPANLRNGLLAYYPFNGNANDESGNGNNGVVNGAGLAADRFGVANAAYLFLSNNSINTPIVLENTTNYSIGGWFKTTSGGTIVGGRELNGPSGLSMVVQSNSTASTYLGQVLWENDNAYGGVGQMSSSEYLDNSWHFIVGTFSNSSPLILPTDFKLYVDGVLLNSLSVNSSTPIPTSPITNNTNFLIGNHRIWPNAGFNGLLDDIIFYNRTLTQEDVSQLYQVQNTVSWSNGATSNSITISPTQTTKYYATIADGISTYTDSVTVNVFGSDFNPFADTIISKQSKVVLDAGAGYTSYKWNTGETTQQLQAIATGTYEVEVSNEIGCKATDRVYVNLFNAVINQNDTTLCKNDSITLTLQEVLPQIDSSTTSANGWKLLIPGSSYDGASTNFLNNNFDPFKSKLYSYANRIAYEFDLNNSTVRNISISGSPMDYGDMIYDYTNERLLTRRAGRDAIFSLPISGGSWSQVGAGGFDAESYGAASYWNPLTQRVGLFGGYGYFATKNWIWENQGANGWLNVYANNNDCNPAKRNGQLARNGVGNKIYLFSGQGSCDGNQFASSCSNSQPWGTDVGVYCWLKDLWEIDLTNYTFKNILPANNSSIIREGSFAYDFDKDVFYNIGGYVPSATYNPSLGASADYSNEVTRFRRGVDQGFVPVSVGGDVPPVVKLNNATGRVYYDSKYKRIIWARKEGIWAMSTSTNKPITYKWSTGDTTQSIRVAANSSIKIYGTVSDGINSSTDSILLNVLSSDTSLQILDNPIVCSNSGSIRLQAGSASSYQWIKDGILIPGATSSLYTATEAGEFRVVVSNANGCSDSSRIVIITLAPPSVAGNITGSSSVCSGTNSTALSLGGYTGSIQWQSSTDNSSFTNIGDATSPINTASNLTATTYFRAIVSNGICLSDTTSTAIITVNQPPSSSIASVTHPTCFTASGTITITSTGILSDTYSIDGINYQSSNIFLGVAAGRYSVTVKSETGCISNAIDVIVNSQPATPSTPVVNVTHPTCFTSTGTITVTSTGILSDTYSIDGTNYQSNNIFSGVAAGRYSVTVKSEAGCISNAIDVIVNAQPVIPTAPIVNVTQPTCFTVTGTITITSTGTLSDTYSIDGINYQSSNIFLGVAAGTYSVTVKSEAGCISNAIDVIVNAQPATPSTPVVNVTQPTCATSTGMITVTSTGILSDTYSIDGINYQSSNIFLGVAAGNYSVTVKSEAGCISNAIDVIVNGQPATPSAPQVNVTQPTCLISTGTITVTATGVATDTYSIDGTNYQSNNIFSGVAAGRYSVTVKSEAGCISNAIDVIVNAQPVIPTAPIVNVTQPTCFTATGTITITSTGTLSDTYSIDGINYQSSNIFLGVSAGTYSVTVKSEAGCISNAIDVIVNAQPATPSTPVVNVTQPTCATATGMITVTSTGILSDTYSIDGINYQSSNIFLGVSAGTYSVTVKSDAGCISNVIDVIVNAQPATPSAPVVNVTQPTCATSSGTITVTSTGILSDTYSIDGINYQSSNIFLGVAAGTYIATVKSDAGCISNAIDVIVNAQPVIPTAPIVNVTQPTCFTAMGRITITSTGTLSDTYSIDGINYQSSNIFLGVAAGTYSVTVKSAAGCVSNAIEVIVNGQPVTPSSPVVNVTQPTCFTATGTITITSTGILSDTYSIDGTNYQSSKIFSGLAASTYIVTVKSAAGCISSATSVMVDAQPVTPVAQVASITQPTCAIATGTIRVSATGVSSDVYSIDGINYQSSNIFLGVSAGTYSVTVKSAAGCVSNAIEVIVNGQPVTPSSPVVNVTQLTCAISTGTITVTSTGVATDTYSINGTTYQLSNIFTSVAPGTYNVTVKSVAGCISTASTLAVNAQPRTPAVPIANVIQPTCAVTTGTITVTSTGVATDTYSINGATYQSSNIFLGLAAGNYSVTVKSAAGCISAATAYVVNALPILDPISWGNAVCIGSSIQLGNSTPNGIWRSASPLVASISATGAVTGLTSGKTEIYYEITNEGSCVAIVSTTITVNPSPVVATITGITSVCVGSTSTLANATPAGLWATDSPNVATVSNTGVVTGISAGSAVISYSVTVNGCSSTSTKTITVNALPVVSDIAGIQNICVGTTSIFASFTSGGTWSSQNAAVATVSNSGLVTSVTAGTTNIRYAVTVNGCTTTVIRSITVNTLPLAPSSITITTVSDVCGNRVYRYTASALTGNATGYQWSFVGTLGLNASLDSGTLNSQVIRMKFTSNAAAATGDSVRVQYTSTGCNSANRAIKLTNSVLSVPTAPASITITTISDVCGSRVYRYTVPALTGAATGYQWSFVGTLGNNATVDSGTLTSRIIRMKFASNAAAAKGDSARVAYTSSCGNSVRRSLKLSNVSLTAPSAPASITTTSVIDTCGGRIFRYTAPALTGSASGYLWSFVGTLGTSASIDSGSLTSRIVRMKFASNAAAATGDSVRVKYTSSCGISPNRSLKLTNSVLTTLNASPASITVALVSNVCAARVYRYTAPALTGTATGYQWSFVGKLGTNAVVDSGSLTSRIVRVKYKLNSAASTGDSVRVAYTSACGIGPRKAMKLTNLALANCSNESSLTLNLMSTKNDLLSTSKDQKVLEVNVFPNPTAGLFNLNVKSSSVEIVYIRVLDVRGRVMKSLKTNPSVTTLIDLNLLPGVYFFEVKQGKEMRIVKAVKL